MSSPPSSSSSSSGGEGLPCGCFGWQCGRRRRSRRRRGSLPHAQVRPVDESGSSSEVADSHHAVTATVFGVPVEMCPPVVTPSPNRSRPEEIARRRQEEEGVGGRRKLACDCCGWRCGRSSGSEADSGGGRRSAGSSYDTLQSGLESRGSSFGGPGGPGPPPPPGSLPPPPVDMVLLDCGCPRPACAKPREHSLWNSHGSFWSNSHGGSGGGGGSGHGQRRSGFLVGSGGHMSPGDSHLLLVPTAAGENSRTRAASDSAVIRDGSQDHKTTSETDPGSGSMVDDDDDDEEDNSDLILSEGGGHSLTASLRHGFPVETLQSLTARLAAMGVDCPLDLNCPAPRGQAGSRLGSGDYGQVHLGIRLGDKWKATLPRRQMAIKITPISFNPLPMEKIKGEVTLLKAAEGHAHLMAIYGDIVDTFRHLRHPKKKSWLSVIVMELIPGGTMNDFVEDVMASIGLIKDLDTGREFIGAAKLSVPVPLGRGWIVSLLEVLQHLHKFAGIAHRDLHAGNMMITGSGDLKVVDLGRSKRIPGGGGGARGGGPADLITSGTIRDYHQLEFTIEYILKSEFLENRTGLGSFLAALKDRKGEPLSFADLLRHPWITSDRLFQYFPIQLIQC